MDQRTDPVGRDNRLARRTFRVKAAALLTPRTRRALLEQGEPRYRLPADNASDPIAVQQMKDEFVAVVGHDLLNPPGSSVRRGPRQHRMSKFIIHDEVKLFGMILGEEGAFE